MTDTKPSDLIKKLGLKNPKDSFILHAPKGYKLPKVKTTKGLSSLGAKVSWLQAFYTLEVDLTCELPTIKERLDKDGSLWICWPKKQSKKDTDLSDSVVRSLGLACGLVDVKVASIDKTWSGLKFVYRLKDRP